MKYRPEIDGLRALAILPVVFHHAGLPGFHGGYLGVDVFLVISGYLITKIVLGELSTGSFSLAGFYTRRARRILPALFTVMAACIPVSLWLMTPQQLTSLGQSMVATSFLASNFYFNDATGYFEGPGELKPLLHTWSLAIEEQFYLFFPPVLALVWWRKRAPQILLGLFCVSILYAEFQNRLSPDAAFFLLPARAWELMFGAAVAWRESRRGPPVSSDLLSLLGLALLGVAFATFDQSTAHPGIRTLMPVAGTALVIAFGRDDGFANRLLSSRLLVATGLISYSLYLWHQPILALARLGSLSVPSVTETLGLIALATVLAWLSWRFVERPFRARARIPSRSVWIGAGVGTLLMVTTGLLFWTTAGLPGRFDPQKMRVLDVARLQANRTLERSGIRCADRPPETACVLGDDVAPTWALLGDSTAGTLSTALDEDLSAIGESGIQLTRTGCIYLPGFRRNDSRNCPERSFAFQKRLQDPRIRRVIVAGRYSFMLSGARFDNGEGGRELGPPRSVVPLDRVPTTDAERELLVLAAYQDSIRDLLAMGKIVYLVYPVPEVGWEVPDHLFKLRILRGSREPITTSSARFRDRNARVIAAFDALGEAPALIRVRPTEWLCDNLLPGRCLTELDGEILYADNNHLNRAGSRHLIHAVMAAREQAVKIVSNR
jgi:peptidoglycan/LPS O-acetylase OafA/YrhL